MSASEAAAEALRWLRFSKEDLEAAGHFVAGDHPTPRHACWLSQQAAEKALKAALYWKGSTSRLSTTYASCGTSSRTAGPQGQLRQRWPNSRCGARSPDTRAIGPSPRRLTLRGPWRRRAPCTTTSRRSLSAAAWSPNRIATRGQRRELVACAQSSAVAALYVLQDGEGAGVSVPWARRKSSLRRGSRVPVVAAERVKNCAGAVHR